jgi:hypothetical protein
MVMPIVTLATLAAWRAYINAVAALGTYRLLQSIFKSYIKVLKAAVMSISRGAQVLR